MGTPITEKDLVKARHAIALLAVKEGVSEAVIRASMMETISVGRKADLTRKESIKNMGCVRVEEYISFLFERVIFTRRRSYGRQNVRLYPRVHAGAE